MPKFARLSFVHFGNLWQITMVSFEAPPATATFVQRKLFCDTVDWCLKLTLLLVFFFFSPLLWWEGGPPEHLVQLEKLAQFCWIQLRLQNRNTKLSFLWSAEIYSLYHSFIFHLLLSFLDQVLAFLGFYRELKLPKACFHTLQFITIITVTCLPAIYSCQIP